MSGASVRMPRSRLVGFVAAVLLIVVTTPALRAGTADPVPVLPGSQVLAPGPRALGLAGPAADPSTIGNFQGTVALVYLRSKVRDSTGRRWLMANDIRLFQGDYVAADGLQRRGTFAFL
jgi:hypothetical protein